MFKIFRTLGDGELLLVANIEDLAKAKQFVQNLTLHWPGEYSIWDDSETEIEPEE